MVRDNLTKYGVSSDVTVPGAEKCHENIHCAVLSLSLLFTVFLLSLQAAPTCCSLSL